MDHVIAVGIVLLTWVAVVVPVSLLTGLQIRRAGRRGHRAIETERERVRRRLREIGRA